jgi:cytosine/adenosine deaminase-related metal-dependent hydrolase
MPRTFRARWLLPIDRPPIADGWCAVEHGVIVEIGAGRAPDPAEDLGDVAVLPGLVNAHTHLELSWMHGRVPPAGSMTEWIRTMLAIRAAGPPGGDHERLEAMRRAAAEMRATGTVLAGDISNTLQTPPVWRDAGIPAVVFHELLGFNVSGVAAMVREACERSARVAIDGDVELGVVAHAPYSTSPALIAEIAHRCGPAPLSIHLAESADEIEFLRTGRGPFRTLLEDLGVFDAGWSAPGCDPVEYLRRLGYLQPGMLAIHAVHLTDDELERLRRASAFVVTCPRSNEWVGGGIPRVAHFYAARVPVAIGTDSLASAPSLNMFDELAELRRLAPELTAATLLDSATHVGARALGRGAEYGTLAPGKRAALITVDIPRATRGVEEYLVSGVPASAVRPL